MGNLGLHLLIKAGREMGIDFILATDQTKDFVYREAIRTRRITKSEIVLAACFRFLRRKGMLTADAWNKSVEAVSFQLTGHKQSAANISNALRIEARKGCWPVALIGGSVRPKREPWRNPHIVFDRIKRMRERARVKAIEIKRHNLKFVNQMHEMDFERRMINRQINQLRKALKNEEHNENNSRNSGKGT